MANKIGRVSTNKNSQNFLIGILMVLVGWQFLNSRIQAIFVIGGALLAVNSLLGPSDPVNVRSKKQLDDLNPEIRDKMYKLGLDAIRREIHPEKSNKNGIVLTINLSKPNIRVGYLSTVYPENEMKSIIYQIIEELTDIEKEDIEVKLSAVYSEYFKNENLGILIFTEERINNTELNNIVWEIMNEHTLILDEL